MQDEINEKVVVIGFRAAKFTASALFGAVKKYVDSKKQQGTVSKSSKTKGKSVEPHGQMSVQDLVGKGEGATNIEIKNKDIHDFEKIARKYNVDFAVQKDKTMNPPRYLVFFKAKDTDVIAQAFREYVKASSKKIQRPSLKAKLVSITKALAQNKNRQRSRDKNKSRGGPEL